MKFIKLTGFYDGGLAHYLKAIDIKEIVEMSKGAKVIIYNNEYPELCVEESPEEILKLLEGIII